MHPDKPFQLVIRGWDETGPWKHKHKIIYILLGVSEDVEIYLFCTCLYVYMMMSYVMNTEVGFASDVFASVFTEALHF